MKTVMRRFLPLVGLALWLSCWGNAWPGTALPAPGGYGNSVATTPRRTAAQRQITLKATRNTRDLGGLPVRGGYLKDKTIYRSGALCFATATDVEKVATLNLRTIIDLRSPKEILRKEGPDRLPRRNSILVINLPMYFKGDRKIGRYYSYAIDNDGALQGFFEALARSSSYPLLFHCSAGKDRTGVLTCLLLELLGTGRSVIMDDYLQSQRNSPGLEVHREWLEEIFALIDKSGGVKPFLQEQGVRVDDLEAIPALLTDRTAAGVDARPALPTDRTATSADASPVLPTDRTVAGADASPNWR